MSPRRDGGQDKKDSLPRISLGSRGRRKASSFSGCNQVNAQSLMEVVLSEPSEVRVPATNGGVPCDSTPIHESAIAKWPGWRRRFFSDWREAAGGKVHALCNLCHNMHYYTGNVSSLTNFKTHLKRNHKEELAAFNANHWIEDQAQAVESTKSTSSQKRPAVPMTTSLPQQQHLENLLARAISIDGIPLNLLASQGFAAFIKELNPNFKIPSPWTMQWSILPGLLEQCRQRVQAQLADCTSYSVVCDVWSPKSGRGTGYVGFTCTGVAHNFERVVVFLGVRPMRRGADAGAVLAEYGHVLTQWNLSEHLVTRVITDGGSSRVKTTLASIPGWETSTGVATGSTSSSEALAASTPPTGHLHGHTPLGVGDHFLMPLLDTVSMQPSTSTSESTTPTSGSADLPAESDGLLLAELLDEFGADTEPDAGGGEDVDHSTDAFIDSTGAGPTLLATELHHTCCVRKLQAVIQDGFKALESPMTAVIKRVSRIVNSVRQSVQDTELIFKSCQVRFQPRHSSRWNTQLHLLGCLVKALDHDPMLQTQLDAVKKHGRLSPVELKALQEFFYLLEPFGEALDDLQADYESIGMVVPAYLDLLNKTTLARNQALAVAHAEPSARGDRLGRSLPDALHRSLLRRFAFVLTDSIFVIGAVLDCRFKKQWIPISGYSEAAILKAVKMELETRYRCCHPSHETSDNGQGEAEAPDGHGRGTSSSSSSSSSSSENQFRMKRSLFSSFSAPGGGVGGGVGGAGSTASLSAVAEELDVYLSEPPCDMWQPATATEAKTARLAVRPLAYWRRNAHRFPGLAVVARQIFGVPASSGSFDAVLAAGHDLLRSERQRAAPDLLTALSFLRRNRASLE